MWFAMVIVGGGIILAPCFLICLILLLFIKNKMVCHRIVLVYVIITVIMTGLLCSSILGSEALYILEIFSMTFAIYNIPTVLMLLICFAKFPETYDVVKIIKSCIKLAIILCLIPLSIIIYDKAQNNLTAITNWKVYTLNLVTNSYQRPPIILSNGNSLWLNKNNVEFYDYSKKKSFHVAKPDSTINFPTLLPGNNVLFTGDVNSYLFDTKTLTFTKTGNLKHKIDYYTSSIVMPNNKVLFIDNSGTKLQIFDEKTGLFYSTTNPRLIMWKQQGIAINSNKILLYGGYKEGKEYYKRVQIYDVSANKFYLPKNQPMQAEEIYPLLLKTGKVLIVGNHKKYHEKYQAYEIYDPISNTFTPLVNEYSENREYPDLTLLNDGSVLIISKNRGNEWRLEREIFYPDSQTFKQIGYERNTYSYFSIHSKVILKGGRVLLLRDNTIVLYDPQTQIFEELGHARKGNSKFIPLNDDEMLIYGGDYDYNTNGHVTIETFNLSKLKDKTKNSSSIVK